MRFEVVLKDELYDELFTLMKHIKEINEGDEIGAWMIGDWLVKDGVARLLLDEMVIPKQVVSGAEVDISPESQMDTIKEIGFEKSNRIKAHWHIHPFGDGKTEWSSIDEEKIRDFMMPNKRDLFVFLLSSFDWVKARVEMNINARVNGLNGDFVINEKVDNLEVKRESQTQTSIYLDKLKKRVEEKVERKKYIPQTNFALWKDNTPLYNNQPEEDLYVINKGKGGVYVSIDNNFAEYVLEAPLVADEIKCPTKIKQKKGKQTWFFEVKEEKNVQRIIGFIEEELYRLEVEYEEAKQETQGYQGKWEGYAGY